MKTKHFILLLSAAMLAACSQKLDIPQHGVITTDTYYQTDSDAQGAVTAIYTALAGRELSDHIVLNLLSDDFWAGATNYTAFHSYNDFSFDADESYLASFFTEHYNVIGRCNILLDKLKPDTDFKAQCIAEAKVARAWMYFSLTTLWGNPPLVDHCLDADEAKVGNSTPEKLWEFIEKDLNDAISSGKLMMTPQKKALLPAWRTSRTTGSPESMRMRCWARRFFGRRSMSRPLRRLKR